MTAVTLSVVGAGHRGAEAYGDYCLRYPDRARVVAVAEPDPMRRAEFAEDHGIPAERQFATWSDLLARDRLSDGLVVATPDLIRDGPVVTGARKGYALLVEKPFAPTEEQLDAMSAAITETGAFVGVAHVLRYTNFYRTVKRLIDEGTIGRLIHIDQTEDIGYWHFAHSYVRGNWRRAEESSPMLLAKSCHDLDLLTWLIDEPAESVSSSGTLTHFTPQHAPEGAPERCTDGCPAADTCPFYAPRLYLDRLCGHHTWPVTAVTRDTSDAGRLAALQDGPYGRCVYRSDNNQVDHQVVTISFGTGVLATLRIGAFTASNTRTIRILGSHGEISGRLDTGELEVRRFLPARGDTVHEWSRWDRDVQGRSGLPDDETWTISAGPTSDPDLADRPGRRESDGHAGGDDGLMHEFVEQVQQWRSGQTAALPTELRDAERSHRIAFAAERSRHAGQTVELTA
ncbi:Gfo/Idh/MocA family protein [Ruania halotolerans]|uniref:Gfo/Idh/MocA family protein n=1 Tax=Ruania halotolerans TaxID=2897773 RepID=UPI001E30AC33|nr:Gfo/Idh/MocA family oxidoreductase [Ruania halotolerans]UFU06146.1 Gfo/Idh/MocA family oxidoreductase [Ruania halotolerans]